MRQKFIAGLCCWLQLSPWGWQVWRRTPRPKRRQGSTLQLWCRIQARKAVALESRNPRAIPTPTTKESTHDPSTGLGPVFNARACSDCHQNPVSGGASQFTELRAGHRDANGNFGNPTIPINDGANNVGGSTCHMGTIVTAAPGTVTMAACSPSPKLWATKSSTPTAISCFTISRPAMASRNPARKTRPTSCASSRRGSPHEAGFYA